MQNRSLFSGVDLLIRSIADKTMLLYFISVVVMASSIASFVINMGIADTERVLITLSSAALFLLGAYGMWVWVRRRAREQSEAA